jgi:histidine triad (HIT) family protein
MQLPGLRSDGAGVAADGPCPFCAIARGAQPDYVVAQDEHTVTFLDHRPLFPGHCLVVPRRHIEVLPDLPDELLAPLLAATRLAARAVEAGLAAQGTFIAMNNRVSQSVPHLHAHVVPRTKGDGLKGFFWPRTPYPDNAAREAVAARLRAAFAAALAGLK